MTCKWHDVAIWHGNVSSRNETCKLHVNVLRNERCKLHVNPMCFTCKQIFKKMYLHVIYMFNFIDLFKIILHVII